MILSRHSVEVSHSMTWIKIHFVWNACVCLCLPIVRFVDLNRDILRTSLWISATYIFRMKIHATKIQSNDSMLKWGFIQTLHTTYVNTLVMRCYQAHFSPVLIWHHFLGVWLSFFSNDSFLFPFLNKMQTLFGTNWAFNPHQTKHSGTGFLQFPNMC